MCNLFLLEPKEKRREDSGSSTNTTLSADNEVTTKLLSSSDKNNRNDSGYSGHLSSSKRNHGSSQGAIPKQLSRSGSFICFFC